MKLWRASARIYACGLAALLLPGTAYADAPAAQPDQQVSGLQTGAAPSRGLFYNISDGTNTLFLFGTIHVGTPEFYPLNSKLTDALRSSKFLAVEADITDQAAAAAQIAAAAMYHEGDSLDRHISAALMQKLQRVLEKYQFPIEVARTMKPWMLSLTLDYLGSSESGYDPLYGADVYLLGLAKEMKKPVAEVESMEFQIRLFESFTPSQQEAFLLASVDELGSGELRTQLKELVDAWGKGDGAAIAKSMAEGEAALPASAKPIMKRLIADRNVSMTHLHPSAVDRAQARGLPEVLSGVGHRRDPARRK